MTVKFSTKSNRFMYADTASSSLLPDNNPFATQVKVLPRMEFFDTIHKQEAATGPWHYYTSKVESLQTNAPNWPSLSYEEIDYEEAEIPVMPPFLSCWITGAGSTTQAHYDVANNVFVQLHGQKRFTLYPPTQHLELSLFPDSHPRARKSQLEVLPPGQGQELVLGPGDALFIPAFWFHHVESLSEAVSLNVFSESLVKLMGVRMFQPLSIDRAASVELRTSAIISTASELLRRFHLSADWLHRVRLSRFQHLAGPESTIPARFVADPMSLPTTQPNSSLVHSLFDQAARTLRALDANEAERAACAELIIAHLLELWVVSLLGSHNVDAVLAMCVECMSAEPAPKI